jgi:hypothetical protein
MIQVAAEGHAKRMIQNRDINALVAATTVG